MRFFHPQVLAATMSFLAVSVFGAIPPTAEVVRQEVVRSQHDPNGRPLPLVAHWHRESLPLSFQLDMIRNGIPVLPWLDYSDRTYGQAYFRNKYGEDQIATLKEWNLPFTLITGGQWEADFYSPEYKALPAEDTGVALNLDGSRMDKVDPMSPLQPWEMLGKKWTDNDALLGLKSLYPNPPRVFFISNNEAKELRWKEAETSKRFIDAYGTGWDLNTNFGVNAKADFVRSIFQAGWIERYSALIRGMRNGLTEQPWKANSRFMAYNATYKSFGPSFIGRSDDWNYWALSTEDRISHAWHTWDGTATEAYDNDWQPDKRAFKYWSVQSEMMNHVFEKDEAYAASPDFWFEIILWDGDSAGNSKYNQYAAQGIDYSEDLYEGWAQYALWLLVPRVAREWRKSDDDHTRWWAYFQKVVDAVSRVHNDPVLEKFWRKGTLVPNLSRGSSFHRAIPSKWANVPRWFHLNTGVDTELFQYPHSGHDFPKDFPVWTLARRIGETPNREWLIYAHAPMGEKSDVQITIPDFGPVTVPTISIGGSFYLLKESDGSIAKVGNGTSPMLPTPTNLEIIQ